jgi:hypothetical protein
MLNPDFTKARDWRPLCDSAEVQIMNLPQVDKRRLRKKGLGCKPKNGNDYEYDDQAAIHREDGDRLRSSRVAGRGRNEALG